MKQASVYKKILSYLYPVLIRKSSGTKNSVLELFLYRGQYQLGTFDALYSDGDRYTPLVKAFKIIRKSLPGINKVLVLGTGLGSAVQILNKQGFSPAFTLVENDATVLNWALELLPQYRADAVCEDAAVFIEKETGIRYDLIVVDIFTGRIVPEFVTTGVFLKNCRRKITPGGFMILNYIVNSKQDWLDARENLDAVFPNNKIHDLGINRLVIAQV